MRIRLGMPMSLCEIARAVGGEVFGNDQKITHITTDSREIQKYDLFIAIQGERFDGEEYVPEAINKSAVPMSRFELEKGIRVAKTRDALLLLAGYYISKLKKLKYKIAITGSVGKTTTKNFLKIILSEQYKTHANEGNYNNEIGMPLSVLSAPEDTAVLICELGMNHAGEIARMSGVLRPDIAVITNIGSSHIGNLGSREAIAKAKLEVAEYINNGVLLAPDSEPLIANAGNTIRFSTSNPYADFYLSYIGKKNISILKNGKELLNTNCAFSEQYLQISLLISTAIAALINLPNDVIKRGILQISQKNIRQKIVSRDKYNFYTDFYNSSPESVFAAIDTIMKSEEFTQKSVLLGDILELGNYSEVMHQEIGKRMCEYALHHIFLFGPMSKHIFDGAVDAGFPLERIFLNENLNAPEITAQQIKDFCTDNEIILMKASRLIKLERVLDYFPE